MIGRIAKQVKAADWRDYVFGFTIGNDVSARDQMFADGQWARAKGYDTFAPIGPWIETELDPSNLEIQSYVDGEPRRHGNTKDLIHKIPDLNRIHLGCLDAPAGRHHHDGHAVGPRRVRARTNGGYRHRGNRSAHEPGRNRDGAPAAPAATA